MLIFIRVSFVILSTYAGFFLSRPFQSAYADAALFGCGIGFLASLLLVLCEGLTRKASARNLSAVTFGLLLGLIASWIVISAIKFIPMDAQVFSAVKMALTLVFCYLGAVTVLRGKDDFNLIIPYVKFSQQDEGQDIILLDTSVIIDGRIADISKTQFLSGKFVIPGFVLKELQAIADSSDDLKRNRGRRGLDILNRIQKNTSIDVQIHDGDFPEIKEVDTKLVKLAKVIGAKVLTNDYNLNKIAQLQGVKVLNINELANALKQVVLPGETMDTRIIKEGKEANQGVGYLEDGTMVVVDNTKNMIGRPVKVKVTSVLQTQAGRMIFA
ncbi:MAG: PIN domain-containing protein, partial [Candidatus Omnitrophota bacterium]